MSSFKTSTVGVLGSAARAAGSLFGGFFGNVADSSYEGQRALGGSAARSAPAAGSLFGGFFGNVADSSYEVQRAIGGSAHDSALKDAVAEIAPIFKQCTRCGNWVCKPIC